MSGVVTDLLTSIDSILALRDSIGAAKKEVWLITRTWSGTELGDGTATDVRTRMLPSPRVVEFNHDMRILEGGAVKQGDVLLKMISKQSYPTENLIDGKSTVQNVEKLYELSGIYYRAVTVTENHVTWTVLLRRLSNQ